MTKPLTIRVEASGACCWHTGGVHHNVFVIPGDAVATARRLPRSQSTPAGHCPPPSALEALTLVVVNVYTASLRGSWCGNCVCELLSFLDEHKHIKYSNVILAWPTMVREDGSGYVTPTRAIEVGSCSDSP